MPVAFTSRLTHCVSTLNVMSCVFLSSLPHQIARELLSTASTLMVVMMRWAMWISVLHSVNVSVFFSSISQLNWSSARNRLRTHAYTNKLQLPVLDSLEMRIYILRSITHPEITEQFPQKIIINFERIDGVDNVRCWFYMRNTHCISHRFLSMCCQIAM